MTEIKNRLQDGINSIFRRWSDFNQVAYYHKYTPLILAAFYASVWAYVIYSRNLLTGMHIGELVFFQTASFWDHLQIMDLDGYLRFSPLGFGLIGWLDQNVIIPLSGFSDATQQELLWSQRLSYFHPLFLFFLLLAVVVVFQELFDEPFYTYLALILFAGNSGTLSQIGFTSTLVCYGLQATALGAILYLYRLSQSCSLASAYKLIICVVISLGLWEQGLNLALAVLTCLAFQCFFKKRSVGLSEVKLYFGVLICLLFIVGFYLNYRLDTGLQEVLKNNKEASYFFSYTSVLLMLDDMLLNVSSLVLHAFGQFLPFPPYSFSVLLNIDMDIQNPYNATYSQYPNMPYRMMNLWYAGVAFTLMLYLMKASIKEIFVSEKSIRFMWLAALSVFMLGFLMHIPVMHRDYFHIPGFILGYKLSIGYVGFTFLMVLVAREVSIKYLGRFSGVFCVNVYCAVIAILALSALSRNFLYFDLTRSFLW